MMTDPVADLFTRIRNAAAARRDVAEAPWSRLSEGLVALLEREGYVRGYEVAGEAPKRTLKVALAYTSGGRSAIKGLRRVSRPSRRVYTSAEDAPQVRNGLGVSILSTPAGLLVDREARSRKVGGEVLCEVW